MTENITDIKLTETVLAGIGPLDAKSSRPGYWEFSMRSEPAPPPRLLTVLSPFIWTVILAYPIYVLASNAFSVGGTPLDALVLGILTFFAVGKPAQAVLERLRKGRAKTLVRMRVSQPANRLYIDGSTYVLNLAEIKKIIIIKRGTGRLRLLLVIAEKQLAIEESYTEEEDSAVREHALLLADLTTAPLEENP